MFRSFFFFPTIKVILFTFWRLRNKTEKDALGSRASTCQLSVSLKPDTVLHTWRCSLNVGDEWIFLATHEYSLPVISIAACYPSRDEGIAHWSRTLSGHLQNTGYSQGQWGAPGSQWARGGMSVESYTGKRRSCTAYCLVEGRLHSTCAPPHWNAVPSLPLPHCLPLVQPSPHASRKPSVVGWIMPPSTWPHPNPGKCEYVTLHRKRTFADTIKLRMLRWADDPGWHGWAWCNHNGPYNRDAGGAPFREGDAMMEAETAVMCFEDGGKGRKPKTTEGHENLKTARKQTTQGSRRAHRRNQPCWHFDLSPGKLILHFWPPELGENKFVLF